MSSILLLHADAATSARFVADLAVDPDLAVHAATTDLAQARQAIARRVPDLLIADLRLSDGRLTELLGELRPARSHVLVCVTSVRDPHLLHALQHGADGHWSTGQPAAMLRALAHRMLASESPLVPELARQILALYATEAHDGQDPRAVRASASRTVGDGGLTDVERRMLQLSSQGLHSDEIASLLGLTAQQVGLLARAVYRRLQLAQRGRVSQRSVPLVF